MENKHAVIIHFYYGKEQEDDFYRLVDEIRNLLDGSDVGEYDGHEIAMDNSDGTFFMYGPNAEELFKAVKPILDNTDFMKGAVANLRFGPIDKDVPEIDVIL